MLEVLEDFYQKEPISDGISPLLNPAERPVNGYGYIILSREATRADYIEYCLRNNVVTILTEKNEIIRNCFVNENVWNYLKFPKSIRTKGSCVIWNCPPKSNRATILATITKRDELQSLRAENCFRLGRENENGTVLIEGSADTGVLNFTVDSDLENGAQASLRILNTLTQGLLDVYIQGNLNIELDDSLNLKIKNTLNAKFIDEFNSSVFTTFNYTLGEGYTMKDEFGNVITVDTKGMVVIVPAGKKIVLQGSTAIQNSVLGNNLVSLIQELISKIDQITVMTPAGISTTPLNALDFTLISQKAKIILSNINYLS